MDIDVSIILTLGNIAIILAVAIEFALGLAVLLRSRNKKETIYFLLLVLAIISWSATIVFSRSFFLLGKFDDFLFWLKLSYITALALPPAAIYFFYSFPGSRRQASFIFSLSGAFYLALPAVFLFYVVLNDYLIKGVVFSGEGVIYLNPPLYLLYTVYIVGYLSIGFSRLIKNYIQSSGREKSQLKIIVIGSLTSSLIASAATLFLPWFRIFDYFWLGPIAMIFLTSAIAYGLVTYQLLNVRLVASEVFTGIIVFILVGEMFFVKNPSELLLRFTALIFILFFSYFLIKSIHQEIKMMEKLEEASEELKKANIRLKKLDMAKTEFLSLASHQLLTPLSTTKGYISMLIEGSFGKIPDAAQEALNRIFVSNERLIKLVHDFLDISRLEMGQIVYKFSKFNLKDLLIELKKEYEVKAEKKNLRFSLVFEGKFPEVYNDKDKLYQVISNLVDNAIRYTKRGSVEIKAEFIQNIEKFIISVKDTGSGLSEKEKAIIFRQFSRSDLGIKTNPQGVGLGLYVSRLLIKGMGGDIWVESQKGKGSAFYVELPMFPSETIKTQRDFIDLMEKI